MNQCVNNLYFNVVIQQEVEGLREGKRKGEETGRIETHDGGR